jgi:uncharacterized protein (TIGR00266 family)
MAFCTNCGNQMDDTARFCARCGFQMGAVINGNAVPVSAPLDYRIEGDNLQLARIFLKPGQELYAEAGKMVYKTPAVEWESRMSGESLGDKIIGALKRKLTGESLFLTYFRASMAGEVGFAGSYPGRIMMFDLGPGQSILCQRDGFLFAQSSVRFSIELVRRLGSGFFGGEGFILQKFTGPGMVFIHGGGDFVEFDLKPGEMLQLETGAVVAFDQSVEYDIQFVGSIKRALFGGEGLFLTTLRGPGRAVIQSMTLAKMRRELAPFRSGGDTRNPIESVTNLFGSDDT